MLHRDGKSWFRYVHRLVLEAFVGPCPKGMECCHEDDNYTNNRLGNLRWDTRLASCRDAGRNGVRARGERHGSAKLKEGQVLAIYAAWHERDIPYSRLREKFGVGLATISNICNGKTWDWLTGHSHSGENRQTRLVGD